MHEFTLYIVPVQRSSSSSESTTITPSSSWSQREDVGTWYSTSMDLSKPCNTKWSPKCPVRKIITTAEAPTLNNKRKFIAEKCEQLKDRQYTWPAMRGRSEAIRSKGLSQSGICHTVEGWGSLGLASCWRQAKNAISTRFERHNR